PIWRRPVILLPACVPQQLEDEELEAVILHELNHVVRHDALVNFAQAVLGAIYFFHPLVWWSNAQIHRLREDACDERTVAALEGRRRAYGSALVKVSTILGYAAPPLALGVMESPHPARRRLGRILDPNLPLEERRGWLAAGLATLLAIVFLPGGPRPTATLAEDRPVHAEPATPPLAEHGRNNTEPLSSRAAPEAEIADEPATAVPELRYRWKRGQSFAYSIDIEADDPEGIETRGGNVSYNVRAAEDGRAVLSVNGALHGVRRPHPGAMFRPGPPSFDFFPSLDERMRDGFLQERRLTVDERGRVLSVRGGSQLPFALGNLAQLALLPLAAPGERSWRRSAPSQIELTHRTADRFPRSPFFRPEPEMLEATESSQFRLVSWTDEEAVIEQHMNLASVDVIEGDPRMEIAGEGEAIFNLDEGLVQSLRWRLKIVVRDQHLSRTTTVTVDCKRLEPAPPAPPSVEPTLAETIAELDSQARETVLAAARRLQQVEPNEQRPEVAARLAKLLSHPDAVAREAAARGFAHWAADEDVAELIDLLDDESTAVRLAAIDALGRLRAAAAIEPLVERLPLRSDRVAATKALAAIGPPCEEAVIELLDDEDESLRLTAVNLLRDVGGPASLAPLKALQERDSQPAVGAWTEVAIESIESRLRSD
ncbi:MAG: HEAT repeat domain-containing protein, partial [Planctomycetes bacterium]|nr:HEAT repeat domain-containing protein [Planctomycetota bacterium]